MLECDELRLCGGTFFALLHSAVKHHTKSQKSADHGFVGYALPELLKAILKVITPGDCEYSPNTLKSMATNFKKCENVPCIPQPDSNDAKLFDERVRSGDRNTLTAMNNLVEHFIDIENKGEWLIRAVVDVLDYDDEIDGNEMLFILPGGKAKAAKDIFNTSDFTLTCFLLGILHYCILKVPNNEVGKDTIHYLFPDGKKLATDIGTDKKFYVSFTPFESGIVNRQENEAAQKQINKAPSIESAYFRPYFDAVHERTHCINTILRAEAYFFEDFYVPMGLGRMFYDYDYEDYYDSVPMIEQPDIEQLRNYSRCLLIQAIGGMGKSMLMKHLMYDGIAHSKITGLIPVYIELKNYNQSNYDILDFFLEEMSKSMPELDPIHFYRVLDESRFVFLLDGLDEVNAAYRGQLLNRLFSFLSKHRDTQVILSSRPYSFDIPLNMFKILAISPMTLDQAIELLNKIEYYPDIPKLKNDFIESLKKNLYTDYKTFAENPLLLTFMLIKFCEDGRMPEKKTDFYEEIFDVLATRHDLKKDGYRRRLESGLSYERLKAYFAAFCSMTFWDGELSFSRSQIITIFNGLLSKSTKPEEQSIDPNKLLEDYVSGVCMLYKEGEKYYFVHRSFQEYFCACSMLKQRPSKMREFSKRLEGDEPLRYDMVLSFLYEKSPEKVEEYIFLPYLQHLIAFCEEGKGYWTYVFLMYPKYHYERFDENVFGEDREISYMSRPRSYFLDFLFRQFPLTGHCGKPQLNQYEEYVKGYYTQITVDGKPKFTTMDDAKLLYEEQGKLSEFYDNPPPKIGYHVSIPTKELYEMRNELPELFAEFERDDFKPKMEYESLKQIKEQIQSRTEFQSNDMVDII